ncbi:MAG: hypothetical protein H6742_10010 [Alphaproteobacteria bacterium]|nr:hypothetical protein [Alphaproteobacteria bacterium]
MKLHLRILLALPLVLFACGDKDDDDTGGPSDSGTTDGGTDTGTVEVDCASRAADLGTGVYGRVMWREGNWMPGDGASSGEEWPLAVAVAGFPPLTTADTVAAEDKPEAYGRYLVPDVAPLATTTADADGCYALELPGGNASVVADDDGAWYCNSFSAAGLCVVTVPPEGAVQVDITVDYMAAY